MPKADSSLNMLIVAAVVALGIGYYVPQTFSQKSPEASKAEAPKAPGAKPQPKAKWAASAPGRVEPAGGEIRISAQAPGRIAEVLVGVNDRVVAGDLLVRLADEDLVARVHAARAEVASRKRDRDDETVAKARPGSQDGGGQSRQRRAPARACARGARSRAEGAPQRHRCRRRRQGARWRQAGARAAGADARRPAQGGRADAPAQTRLEAGLAAARAELSLAEAALERTRIRAPSDGNVLQSARASARRRCPRPRARCSSSAMSARCA